jgi:hypothetical protein
MTYLEPLRPNEILISWAEARTALRDRFDLPNADRLSMIKSQRLLAATDGVKRGEPWFAADAQTRLPVFHSSTMKARRRNAEKATTTEEFVDAATDRSRDVRRGLSRNKKTPKALISQLLADYHDDEVFARDVEYYAGIGYYVE